MAKTLVQEEKIRAVAREETIRVLREVMSDPDQGLEFRPEFIRRFKKSIQEAKSGKTAPFEKILARYR